MKRHHVVRPGDCFASIAAKYGIDDGGALYDAPENGELRALRPNPNILHPGDIVAVPERFSTQQRFSPRRDNVFRVAPPKTRLCLTLRVTGAHTYHLAVGGAGFKGTTDGSRPIVHEVDASETEGEIALWPATYDDPISAGVRAIVVPLRIGHLDPADSARGVQQRLLNLGYSPGSIDGRVGPKTTGAILAFQRDHPPLATDGGLSEEFSSALAKAHGC